MGRHYLRSLWRTVAVSGAAVVFLSTVVALPPPASAAQDRTGGATRQLLAKATPDECRSCC
jgi:hypothetical protein